MRLSTSISSWSKQNTDLTGTFDVHRTTSVIGPAAATFSIEAGPTGAETGTQLVVNAYALAANVPTIFNWWKAVPAATASTGASYFQGFSSTGATGSVIGESSGYHFS